MVKRKAVLLTSVQNMVRDIDARSHSGKGVVLCVGVACGMFGVVACLALACNSCDS
jgi:hypothetical protein